MPDETDRDALIESVAREIHSETCPGRPCGSYPRHEEMAAAAAAIFSLESKGWGPCASRCRHHDGICSGIVDANEAMGEALSTARAEAERMRGVIRDAVQGMDVIFTRSRAGDTALTLMREVGVIAELLRAEGTRP